MAGMMQKVLGAAVVTVDFEQSRGGYRLVDVVHSVAAVDVVRVEKQSVEVPQNLRGGSLPGDSYPGQCHTGGASAITWDDMHNASIAGIGKMCPGNSHSACLNGNTEYGTLDEAFWQCGRFRECAYIMRYKNGTEGGRDVYVLRRETDPDSDPTGWVDLALWSVAKACGKCRSPNLWSESLMVSPKVMTTGVGKRCPDNAQEKCLNGNKVYPSLQEAWKMCILLSECSYIFAYVTPSGPTEYVLRRGRMDPTYSSGYGYGNRLYSVANACAASYDKCQSDPPCQHGGVCHTVTENRFVNGYPAPKGAGFRCDCTNKNSYVATEDLVADHYESPRTGPHDTEAIAQSACDQEGPTCLGFYQDTVSPPNLNGKFFLLGAPTAEKRKWGSGKPKSIVQGAWKKLKWTGPTCAVSADP